MYIHTDNYSGYLPREGFYAYVLGLLRNRGNYLFYFYFIFIVVGAVIFNVVVQHAYNSYWSLYL